MRLSMIGRIFNYFEAARFSKKRKQRREIGGPNTEVLRSRKSLLQQARHFEQNYDLVVNALNILEQNIIGAEGIMIEPMPRNDSGEVMEDVADIISKELVSWSERPEVTGEFDFPSAQRIMCRSWLRDGEVFVRRIVGRIPGIGRKLNVPFLFQMLETDMLDSIAYGNWGNPISYYFYKSNPSESSSRETVKISSKKISHLKNYSRIGQNRGHSILSSVLIRIDDLKDYDDSERIAAKVAASMAAYVKKGTPDMYDSRVEGDGKEINLRPGMVFDNLFPGEEISTIDVSRPSSQLSEYRDGQIRMVSGGVSVGNSSLSKKYDGTYSAQRQELVEQFGRYKVLSSLFISSIMRPIYRDFIFSLAISGKIDISLLDSDGIYNAFYSSPPMPWIDPKKEAEAFKILEESGHASGIEIARRRGLNPKDLIDSINRWEKMKGG